MILKVIYLFTSYVDAIKRGTKTQLITISKWKVLKVLRPTQKKHAGISAINNKIKLKKINVLFIVHS